MINSDVGNTACEQLRFKCIPSSIRRIARLTGFFYLSAVERLAHPVLCYNSTSDIRMRCLGIIM